MSLKLKLAYVNWLRGYDWAWFGTLTVRDGVWRKGAIRLFGKWVAQVQAAEPEPISWVRMGEFSSENHRFHIHVLIAGVQRCNVRRAIALWERMAGIAEIGEYDPTRRGLEYALKSMEDTLDFDIDFQLHNQHLRPKQQSESLQTLPADLVTTDGLRRHYEMTMFELWSTMRQKCRSPKPPNYNLHGDKRLPMCWRWRGHNGFELFVKDMGERPSPVHRLRRIDRNAGYSPSNCIWEVPGN